MRDLEQEYKNESGYDVGKIHDIGTTYFSNNYVEWLEKQVKKLNIDDVSNQRELLIDFLDDVLMCQDEGATIVDREKYVDGYLVN